MLPAESTVQQLMVNVENNTDGALLALISKTKEGEEVSCAFYSFLPYTEYSWRPFPYQAGYCDVQLSSL